MQDFVGYMFFSFIEGFAVFALMFYLFRINMMKYIRPIILTNLFINFLSFFIRQESVFSDVSPIMNLAVCVLFVNTIVRIPLIWSVLIVLSGYMAYGALQTTLIFFSFLSIDEVQAVVWKTYTFQLVSGSIGTAIGYTIYRLGYGFTFEFEKLRFKWERILILSMIIIFIVFLIVSLLIQSIFSIAILFAIALVFFLLYSYWKDGDE